MRSIEVILHNIRSAHNVGAIFRTADGAGVKHLYLTGYTPAPSDRFGRPNESLRKTALGAVDTIPYSANPDVLAVIADRKKAGYTIVMVEQTERAIPYTSYDAPEKVMFVFGNEITGIENEVLDAGDAHIHLPMYGTKESLNVSTCAGIILFSFRS